MNIDWQGLHAPQAGKTHRSPPAALLPLPSLLLPDGPDGRACFLVATQGGKWGGWWGRCGWRTKTGCCARLSKQSLLQLRSVVAVALNERCLAACHSHSPWPAIVGIGESWPTTHVVPDKGGWRCKWLAAAWLALINNAPATDPAHPQHARTQPSCVGTPLAPLLLTDVLAGTKVGPLLNKWGIRDKLYKAWLVDRLRLQHSLEPAAHSGRPPLYMPWLQQASGQGCRHCGAALAHQALHCHRWWPLRVSGL